MLKREQTAIVFSRDALRKGREEEDAAKNGWMAKKETKKKGDKTERQTTALIRFGTGGKAEPERESEWAGECARGVTLS